MKIEVIRKETGTVTNVMVKTLAEYSEWLERAFKRGYTVAELNGTIEVYDEVGNNKNNFRVKL